MTADMSGKADKGRGAHGGPKAGSTPPRAPDRAARLKWQRTAFGADPDRGAKNACLTLMPATLLSEEPLTLTNAPRLSDIRTMSTLLQSLGAR
jgi:hypothetical protein